MRNKPQISPTMFIPLLDLDSVPKGIKIHKPNDQNEVHWQLTTYIVKGIDNAKEVLIVDDLEGKPAIIPFMELTDYFVNKFNKGKKKLPSKKELKAMKKAQIGWDTRTYKEQII